MSPKEKGVVFKEKFEGYKYEVPGQRNTVHFTMNGEVSSNSGGNWEVRKYAIVIPLKNVDKDKFIGGTPVDFFSECSVESPKGSYIICSEENQKEIAKEIEFVTIDNENVNKYVDTLIDKLGYKVESIGDYDWGNEKDSKTVKSIMKDNGWKIDYLHSGTPEHCIELFLEDCYRTANRAKIIKNHNIDTKEFCFYESHGSNSGQKIEIVSDEKYLRELNNILKDISKIELPELVINELLEIQNSSIKNEVKSKLNQEELEEYKNWHNTTVEKTLRKRILGEIELDRFQNRLDERQDFKFSDVAQLYKAGINDYTTSDRREEFFDERNIRRLKIKKFLFKYGKMQKYTF